MRATTLLAVLTFVLGASGVACSAQASAQATGSRPLEPRAAAPTPGPAAPGPIVIPIPQELGLDAEDVASVQTLANADAFRGEAVGFSGEPTAEVAALRRLARHREASRVFVLVVERGTLSAQLFALAGLYVVDPPRFQEKLASYRTLGTPVKVLHGGCDAGFDEVAVRNLLEVKGAMQLDRPDETIEQWVRRNPGNRQLVVDLVGGGLSLVLLSS